MVSIDDIDGLQNAAPRFVRISTADRGQTVENQLQPLQEAAGRLGWTIVEGIKDEGVSGARAEINDRGWTPC